MNFGPEFYTTFGEDLVDAFHKALLQDHELAKEFVIDLDAYIADMEFTRALYDHFREILTDEGELLTKADVRKAVAGLQQMLE